MRIGLITPLNGRQGTDAAPPSWRSVRELALTAEQVGFDSFVFEDAHIYRSDDGNNGSWESMTIAAALAVATTQIHIGQSVVNSPYRQPTMVAKQAATLDEVSGGRYILGIGAGNTADDDYAAFGVPTDHRYSRFAEAIEIIHSLLKTGHSEFDGEYYSVVDNELVLLGPNPQGPPINVAGAGSKMLRLVARFADAWNWWGYHETIDELQARMRPIVDELEKACAEHDREQADIARTIDIYTIVPPGMASEDDDPGLVRGSAGQIAEYILRLRDLGFAEVRCDLTRKTPEAVEAMTDVVAAVHAA